jgi:hypothetical protein
LSAIRTRILKGEEESHRSRIHVLLSIAPLSATRGHMTVLMRAWDFMRERRKYWFIPITTMLVVVCSLFLSSVIARLVPIFHQIF